MKPKNKLKLSRKEEKKKLLEMKHLFKQTFPQNVMNWKEVQRSIERGHFVIRRDKK